MRSFCYPLPTLGSDSLGFSPEFLGHETIEQRHVLQPAAVVVFEQIPHYGAAGPLVGVQPDQPRAAVGCTDRILRQHPPDLIRLVKLERLTLSQTCSCRAWSAVTEKAMSCSSVMPSSA